MVALQQVVLKLFKGIQAFFSSLSGVLDFFRTKNDQEAGANKILVKQNDKRDEIRKDSDRVWDGDDRNRMQRPSGKGRK